MVAGHTLTLGTFFLVNCAPVAPYDAPICEELRVAFIWTRNPQLLLIEATSYGYVPPP